MSADRSQQLRPPQRALKKATKDLVEAVGGDVAGASYCRVSKSQLSDYGNQNLAQFMPIDVVQDLETVAGEPIVTRLLAAAQGYFLVPRFETMPKGAWGRALQSLGKEFGDVAQRLCEAIGDPESPGEVTAAEVAEKGIIAELDGLAEHVARMRAMAVQVVEAAGGEVVPLRKRA